MGIKEFDEYVVSQQQSNKKEEVHMAAGSTLVSKGLLKSLPSENNKSKKLLNRVQSSEVQMEVEPYEKIE